MVVKPYKYIKHKMRKCNDLEEKNEEHTSLQQKMCPNGSLSLKADEAL